MASPRYEGSPEPPNLHVQRLEATAAADAESVVMVKLTDEIFAALTAAQRKGVRLAVKVDGKGGMWDLGPCGTFHFMTQQLSGETDTVCEDKVSNTQRTVGSYKTKYQIQATDKSFAETRDKAQKLMEEEKSRGTKGPNRPPKNAAPRIGTASSSRHSSPLMAKTDPSSKISPNKFSNATGTNGGSHNGSTRQNADPLAGELRKKKLRTRIVHLIVTGKYSSVDEISAHLRRDGVNEEEGLSRRVEEIVADISERNDSGKIFLKPSQFNEVDQRWPWFSREEKDAVRRTLNGGAKPNLGHAAFAPMRKKGIERMQAPAHPSSQNVSPEAIPTPPVSRPASSDGGSSTTKSSPPIQRVTPDLSPTTPMTEIDYSAPSNGNKRKAHVPNPGVTQVVEKRPRQESASPPEDPTTHPTLPKEKVSSRSGSGGGSTGSSRLSSPCTLSSPQRPSCDWDKKFPEIRSVQEAEKYFNMFHSDYGTYMECYKHLQEVAQEFRAMDNNLKKAGRHSKESIKIERGIQERYAHFEKNDKFLKARQQHTDLRSKLTVLKQRIADWERTQDSPAVF